MTRLTAFVACAKSAWLAGVFLSCLTFATAAAAQTVTPPPVPDAAASRELDKVAADLKEIEAVLQRHDVSETDLQSLRDRAAPLVAELQTVLGHLQVRLATVKARLDQLGPPPDAKAGPENAQVTKERQQQQKDYEAVDALVKSAKLLLVQVEQINARIAARQHAKFTQPLVKRGKSIADPNLWLDVVAVTPHNLKTARGAIGDWIGNINQKLPGWRSPTFWASVLAVLAFYWPLSAFARRKLAQESDTARPSRLRKITAAWRTTIIIAGFPLLAFLAIAGLLRAFNLFDEPMLAVLLVLFNAVFRVAVAAGLAGGLLAPAHANWRLIDLSDERCKQARTAILAVAVLVAVSHLIISLCKIIGADETYQAALRGIAAVCVAVAIVAALWGARATECGPGETLGPRVTTTRDWYGILRILLWIAAVAIIVAVVAGFMGLAGFLVEQIYWVGCIGFVAVMSHILAEEAIAAGCTPTAPFGRALMRSIGLHRNAVDQLAILLSGAATVAIFAAAVLLVLAPWGIQSTDLSGYFRAAFFGFHVGNITVSLSSVMIAIGIFIAGTTATRAVKGWLDLRFLPHTRLDRGLRNAIKTSFGYLGFVLALGFALAYLGVSFEKLAIVAGALSVGIGFGLQSIVNNFVSGLILLWERAIRVGDWIVVGGEEGLVRHIHVRSTKIETFDRAMVIVPNSNLIAGVVKNYVRTDRSGRIQISVPVNSAADPEMARDLLLEIAKGHRLVLDKPAPQVIFSGITAAAFNFDLYCFIADVAALSSVKSELNFEIYRRFKEAGLFAVPLPTSVVTLAGLEKFEPLLNKLASAAGGNVKQTG
ncbi:MAG: DUF3772 domain-containing protein [Methylovirgula sp.]